MTARFPSVFISHASADRELAHALAVALGRRGIVPYLALSQPEPGDELPNKLAQQACDADVFVALVSSAWAASPWCQDHELAPRLARRNNRICPVFLEAPIPILQQLSQVAHWLDGDQVAIESLFAFPERNVEGIASQLCATTMASSGLPDSPQLLCILDQRGGGSRVGPPPPHQIPTATEDLPPLKTLVFRPDLGARSTFELVPETDWPQLQEAIWFSLSTLHARPRELWISGDAQLAMYWLVGTFFDRSHRNRTRVVHRSGQSFELDFGEPRFSCAVTPAPKNTLQWEGGDGAKAASVDIYIGQPRYLDDVRAFREQQNAQAPPLAHYPTGVLNQGEELVPIAAWLAAAVAGRPCRLFTSLPNHGLPLLAAQMKHCLGPVTFMERDLAAKTYRAYPMPSP